jgi:acyl carrier protein
MSPDFPVLIAGEPLTVRKCTFTVSKAFVAGRSPLSGGSRPAAPVTPSKRTLGFGAMGSVARGRIRELMGEVMTAQGRTLPGNDAADLREIGFRSLDFSELALRVEDELGDELNFDAPGLRRIATVGDVLDFIEQLQSA